MDSTLLDVDLKRHLKKYLEYYGLRSYTVDIVKFTLSSDVSVRVFREIKIDLSEQLDLAELTSVEKISSIADRIIGEDLKNCEYVKSINTDKEAKIVALEEQLRKAQEEIQYLGKFYDHYNLTFFMNQGKPFDGSV